MKLGNYTACNTEKIDTETDSTVHAAIEKRWRGLLVAWEERGH